MKKLLVCLMSIYSTAAAAAPMVRVIAVTDSRTIVIDSNGARTSVTLSGVSVATEEESAAADYLRRIVGDAWVYVEGGEVYRSPDALYVNGEMIRHSWRTSPSMKYLGELELGPRPAPAVTKAKAPKRAPRGKAASRSVSRRSARVR